MHAEVFSKKRNLKNFVKFMEKNLRWSLNFQLKKKILVKLERSIFRIWENCLEQYTRRTCFLVSATGVYQTNFLQRTYISEILGIVTCSFRFIYIFMDESFPICNNGRTSLSFLIFQEILFLLLILLCVLQQNSLQGFLYFLGVEGTRRRVGG